MYTQKTHYDFQFIKGFHAVGRRGKKTRKKQAPGDLFLHLSDAASEEKNKRDEREPRVRECADRNPADGWLWRRRGGETDEVTEERRTRSQSQFAERSQVIV